MPIKLIQFSSPVDSNIELNVLSVLLSDLSPNSKCSNKTIDIGNFSFFIF